MRDVTPGFEVSKASFASKFLADELARRSTSHVVRDRIRKTELDFFPPSHRHRVQPSASANLAGEA